MEATRTGTVERTAGAPTVNIIICSGCGRCVAACPQKIITLDVIRFHKNAVIRYPERCNTCGCCIHACPIAALVL